MESATAYYENRVTRLRLLKGTLEMAIRSADHFIDTEEDMRVPVTDTESVVYVKDQLAKLISVVHGEMEATRAMLDMAGEVK